MTLAEQLETVIGQGQVCENEPMKNHTTFRIGGRRIFLPVRRPKKA